MSDEEAFGMFWWYEMLKREEQERRKRCPNCKSRRTRHDENRDIWVCSDCNYEWKDEEDY